MGTLIERMAAERQLNFGASLNSEAVDVKGYRAAYVLVVGNMVGQTLSLQAADSAGTWHAVRDASGSAVTVPATTAGWVPIEFPGVEQIRLVSGVSITQASRIALKS